MFLFQEPVNNIPLDKPGCSTEGLDQKPTPWELMQHSFLNTNTPGKYLHLEKGLRCRDGDGLFIDCLE